MHHAGRGRLGPPEVLEEVTQTGRNPEDGVPVVPQEPLGVDGSQLGRHRTEAVDVVPVQVVLDEEVYRS